MANTKRWYKLTSGSKTMGGPGGRKLVFRRGDLLELTEEEARGSAHQLEPTTGPPPKPAPAEKVVPPAPEKVTKKEPAEEVQSPPTPSPEEDASPEPEPPPPSEVERALEGNVGQVAKYLAKIDDVEALREASRVEAGGKDRKGVHDAVKDRIQELAAAGEEAEGEGGEES